MRCAVILVERDEHLSIATTVPLWEVPILEFIHSPEKVTVKEEVLLDLPIPDPVKEYERLGVSYGADAQDKSFVSEIYGQGPSGIRAITQAIAENSEAPQLEDPTA